MPGAFSLMALTYQCPAVISRNFFPNKVLDNCAKRDNMQIEAPTMTASGCEAREARAEATMRAELESISSGLLGFFAIAGGVGLLAMGVIFMLLGLSVN